MKIITKCCGATYQHRTELKGEPLSEPFSQLPDKQKAKVTFLPYCGNCGKLIKPIEAIVVDKT